LGVWGSLTTGAGDGIGVVTPLVVLLKPKAEASLERVELNAEKSAIAVNTGTRKFSMNMLNSFSLSDPAFPSAGLFGE
jgi:hypothetical protein